MTPVEYLRLHPNCTIEVTMSNREENLLILSIDHHSYQVKLTGDRRSDNIIFENYLSNIHNGELYERR